MKKLVLSWYDWQSGNKKQSDFLYDCFSEGFEPNYIIDFRQQVRVYKEI